MEVSCDVEEQKLIPVLKLFCGLCNV